MSERESRSEYESRFHRVLEYIDQHLDQSLDLDTLAQVAHFSPLHFHRLFSAWMGETLGDYLRRRRIEIAACACWYSRTRRSCTSRWRLVLVQLKRLRALSGCALIARLRAGAHSRPPSMQTAIWIRRSASPVRHPIRLRPNMNSPITHRRAP